MWFFACHVCQTDTRAVLVIDGDPRDEGFECAAMRLIIGDRAYRVTDREPYPDDELYWLYIYDVRSLDSPELADDFDPIYDLAPFNAERSKWAGLTSRADIAWNVSVDDAENDAKGLDRQ